MSKTTTKTTKRFQFTRAELDVRLRDIQDRLNMLTLISKDTPISQVEDDVQEVYDLLDGFSCDLTEERSE